MPFKVTHPWASFLVGGGPHLKTCVEIVRNDTKALVHRSTGVEAEELRRVAVDLKGLMGKEIFIRVVDRHTGHWGHVNFDDFRFHAEQPKIDPRAAPPAPDAYKFAGLSPQRAAQAMTVPEGFEVKLFAGEPDIVQPVAMCLDDRGRVWVAEAYSYPIRRNEKDAKDRILIFEDTDGDGTFDKRTVFMEGLNLVSGLEVGFGGVWIGAAPYLMFVPMKADKAAGPPQILLDGWGWQDTHETLNSFIWGPDGWLYGCHGVFTHSLVGKPGTPPKERTPINAGVWRYHPRRHVFEVFAQGTSNPWGLDFDDRGQAFVEACVIPHCFHIIQGARYHRQAGQHFNPHTYDDIKTIADHFHYLGATPHGGNNRSDTAGGGHAHCGLMCYLGGTWPEPYRNSLFMGNIHGRRLNVDVPKAKGSGYVATHSPDFLLANDAWARFINFRYGPDGNVTMIDWYDKQACHHGDPKIWDRSNGRIYRIQHRDAKAVQVDLGKCTETELIEHQKNKNDWYVRHARRLLQERGISNDGVKSLTAIASDHPDATRRLRGWWALHASGKLTADHVNRAIADSDAYVRGWAVQLAMEQPLGERINSETLTRLAKDESPVVRRFVASATQKLLIADREAVLRGLLAWEQDSTDHNLPLLYWYALEPVVGDANHRTKGLELALNTKISPLLAFGVRRTAADGSPEAIETLAALVAKTSEPNVQLTILRGINEALKGRRDVPMPASWAKAFAALAESGNAEVRSQAFALAVTFGDRVAFDRMRDAIRNPKADLALRQTALAALLTAKDPALAPILQSLLDEPAFRSPALRGLAAYDDPKTADRILSVFAKLPAEEKRDALATLASRASFGKDLLAAVNAKKIASNELSADLVRQLRNLRDKVDRQITRCGASSAIRPPIEQTHRILSRSAAPRKPHRMQRQGRAIYAKTCSANVTRSSASAARSAPTLPAQPTAAISATCSKTSSIQPSSRKSTPRR
ncbi:MAG: PVC-type heme-binding CxxCH protein [Gemmataceae bacterium]